MVIIQKSAALFEEKIANYLKEQSSPQSLYIPMEYMIQIGGKRLRPAVLMATSYYYNTHLLESSVDAALAVEVFHNFTLIHDDIMDAASLRRGNPTAHMKYGIDSAILTGDVMLIKCYDLLMRYPPDVALPLVKVFNKMAIELCEGQRLDMDFEKRFDVSIYEYIEMITFKTSVLLGASMQMGAIIASASEEEERAIYEFGKNIGIAFQIQDDILDIYGEEAEVGKRKAGDIIQNKKTYLYLKALELAEGVQKEYLTDVYMTSSLSLEEEVIKIDKVTKIFDSLVVREYANQLKDAYRDLALSHLVNAGFGNEGIEEFKLFADYLLNRTV